MAYEKQTWVDHIVDNEGNVQQQGTAMDALHFNHIESGIENASQNEVIFFYDEDGYLCVKPYEAISEE